jgi:beta propeller repeat protein
MTHAVLGCRLRITPSYRAVAAERVPPRPRSSVVEGGPIMGRVLAVTLLAIFITSGAGAAGYRTSVGAGADEIPVVVVSGTPYDMGYSYGSLMASEVNACMSGYLSGYQTYDPIRYGDAALDAAWAAVSPYVKTRFVEEMQGVADGSGASYLMIRRAHCVSLVSDYACSGVCVWGPASANGHLYQIRNLDYTMEVGLQNYPVIVVYLPNSGIAHASVGFAGWVGAIAGINAQGIALTEKGASPGSDYPFDLDGVPFWALFRDILQDAYSLDQGLNIVSSANRLKKYYYFIGDGDIPAGRKLRAFDPNLDIWSDNDPADEVYPNVLPNVVYITMDDAAAWSHLNANYGNYNSALMIELSQLVHGGGNLMNVVYDNTTREMWVAYAEGMQNAYLRAYVHFNLNDYLPAAPGKERAVCVNSAGQYSPDIWGDRIVWADDRGGNFDIYMKDLYTGLETAICAATGDQLVPAIHGDRIVWQDNRNANSDIYMYDLATATETPICTNPAAQENPAIWGDRVVWQDYRNGNWDIYMYDLATASESAICTDAAQQTEPAVFGDRIVWVDDRNGNNDIYMYDLSTSSETAICTQTDEQLYPDIWGDRIVWTDERAGMYNWDIYMYDLSTSTETAICTAADYQVWPAIWCDRIVWSDSRDGIQFDIRMYDLSTSTETVICSRSSDEYYPVVDGDRIAWQDYRSGSNWDIYMRDLDPSWGEQQITNLASDEQYPDIFDQRIVWWDFRSGMDIYMYDLATATEMPICTDGSGQYNPAVWGDRIVWRDDRDFNPAIYMYDLVNAAESAITEWVWGGAYYPAIWGDRVVWVDDRNGNNDIYMYDLATATETPICTNPGNQEYPSIWGDRIVWEDQRNGDFDVYMYDLATATETPICTAPGNQQWPAIWGDRIVWDDLRNGNEDIYMYDLATATETPVCTAPGDQQWPAIWGDRVVWHDYRNGNWDIYMYDLATATEVAICTAPGDQKEPAIWGDRIVWQDYRNGNWDIYMNKLATCSFDDVVRSHPMWPGVEALVAHGVTSGTSVAPPLYSPASNVTRGQMASFICKAFGLTWYDPGAATFTDVPRGSDGIYGPGIETDGTHPFYGYVERLYVNGITGGIGGGLYGPANSITRGQMAVFICKAAGKTWYDPGTATFTDVSRGTNGTYDSPETDGTHPFYGWIERLADNASWPAYGAPTKGTSSTTFSPAATCTRGQMATFIQKAVPFEPPVR